MLLNGGSGTSFFELSNEGNGYFSGALTDANDGTLYKYRLDGGDLFPDPVTRFQPEGPHGPSQVINPEKFRWTDHEWQGVKIPGQIIYELHVGTFTPEGTYRSVIPRLEHLKDTGITIIELMPLAEKYLTAADWLEIDTAFLGHTDPLLGAEVGARYDTLFSRIVNLAPPPIGLGPET